MAINLTQHLLDQMPTLLTPGGPEVDATTLRLRVAMLDRQDSLLALARWLHEHDAALGHMAFDMRVDDEQGVCLDSDEVWAGDIPDRDTHIAAVHRLEDELNQMMGEDTTDMMKKIIKELNQVGWDQRSWQVLARHAPVPREVDAGAWLASHRAAWTAEALEDTTASAGMTRPGRRI